MKDILNKLYETYQKERYLFDNPENIRFESKKEDIYTIDISLVKDKEEFYIFIYISEEDELKFKGLYKKANSSLDFEFETLFNALSNLNLEDFVNTYYNELLTNNSIE